MNTRILITGSRNWTNIEAIRVALNAQHALLGSATLVSGACPTGADAIAETHWRSLGLPIERHSADWRKHGKAAGPIRNNHMVALGADICLAFIASNSKGATQCANAAEKANIPVIRY